MWDLPGIRSVAPPGAKAKLSRTAEKSPLLSQQNVSKTGNRHFKLVALSNFHLDVALRSVPKQGKQLTLVWMGIAFTLKKQIIC